MELNEYLKLIPNHIKEKDRTPGTIKVRIDVILILRNKYELSYPEIGKILNRGHSSIINAVRKSGVSVLKSAKLGRKPTPKKSKKISTYRRKSKIEIDFEKAYDKELSLNPKVRASELRQFRALRVKPLTTKDVRELKKIPTIKRFSDLTIEEKEQLWYN